MSIHDFSAERAQFTRDGFVVIRDFLDSSELAQLQHELTRYITDVVPGLPTGSAFYVDRKHPETLKQLQHMGCDRFFQEYRRHSKWNALATALLGEPVEIQEPEWFNKPAGTAHPTPPHQDNYYFCLRPPQVVTLWLALDEVDEENGCLRYVAGSHLCGIRPHNATKMVGFSQGIADYGPEDRTQEVPVHLHPGDLVAHHGNTIHSAAANQSEVRHRRAFAMVCRGVSCQRDEDAFQRYEAALKSQHQELGLAAKS